VLEDGLLAGCMMFPSFLSASVLGADLDLERRDIHHLLAVTPFRSSPDDVLAPLAVRGLTNFVAGSNCATVQNVAQLT